MAKAIRDIVPKKKPTDFTPNFKDYDTESGGAIDIDSEGVTYLHKGKKFDHPYDNAAFDVPTKHKPDDKHGHIPAPKDREINDELNQRETPKKKRVGSALTANIITRRQAGSSSQATSESVEHIDEDWVVKHPDGKYTKHTNVKDAMRHAREVGGKAMATHGFGGMRPLELFGKSSDNIQKAMIKYANKDSEESGETPKKKKAVRESKMECESCSRKMESGSCDCKSTEPRFNPKGKKLLTDKKKSLDEKAVSVSQQRLFGMALAYKRGESSDASPEVKKLADQMSEKQLRDFAKTKTKGLPYEKVEEEASASEVMMEKAMKKVKKEKESGVVANPYGNGPLETGHL